MRGPTAFLSLALLAGLAAEADPPAAAAPVSPDLAAGVERLLARLDADEFTVREDASREAAGLPFEALPLLEASLRRDDLSAEVRFRLQQAVEPVRRRGAAVAARERRTADREWRRRTLAGDYDRIGRKDPKWDAAAREALETAAALWNGDPGATEEAVLDAARRAEAAGCEDPLVRYLQVRMIAAVGGAGAETGAAGIEEAARRLEPSAYHPYWRCTALVRAADARIRSEKEPSPETKTAARTRWESAFALLPAVTADPKPPRSAVVDLADYLTETGTRTEGDRKAVYDRIAPVLSKAWAGTVVPLSVRGRVFIDWGWDARGGGWAQTVTADGWRLLKERLGEARGDLTRAWEMDPTEPSAPTAMLTVELGDNRGRESMETWFRRALDADPDNLAACDAKLYWLEPKWHGTPEDMLAFGRECLDGGNWTAGLPLILARAHEKLIHYQGMDAPSYYGKPEVWKDIRDAYGPFLEKFPRAVAERTKYVRMATLAGAWDVAHEQFEIVGDAPRRGIFPNESYYRNVRRSAARLAAWKRGEKDPPPAGPPIGRVRIEIEGDTLNVRAAPGTAHPVIGTFQGGDEIDVYERVGNWWRIHREGREGWISGKYAKPLGEIPEAPAPAEPPAVDDAIPEPKPKPETKK